MEDTFRHQGMRRKLVEQVKKKGINDEKVIAAIAKVPRHFFMDKAFLEFAYEDKAFAIEAGQTISQPYTVAYQTQHLLTEKGQKVLEIGTGSGYQTCILAEMGVKVFSIERQKVLFEKTKKLLTALGYNSIKLFYGDGFKGLPAFAPFDRILVTCGAPYIPTELIQQLKPGGIMVVPVGNIDQTMTVVIKKDDQHHEVIQLDKFKFVPMLENKVK